jgi:hypothetical protein
MAARLEETPFAVTRKDMGEARIFGGLLCARDAALAHPDNKLSGPPEIGHGYC